MIWAILLLGTVLVVAAAVTAIVSPAKVAIGLIGTGLIVSVAFIALAITSSVGGSGPMGGFSHAQLEADRIMTQQMASVVGPGMESQMTTNAMLQRSANDAYLRALEQHVYQVDRMLGRVP
jgi:hypothetical protein